MLYYESVKDLSISSIIMVFSSIIMVYIVTKCMHMGSDIAYKCQSSN